MKKYILILMLFLISSFAFATVENNTVIGSPINLNLVYSTSEPLDSAFYELQDNNAQSPIDVGSKFMSAELKKLKILEDVSFMWSLIAGLILIYFEVIKSVFYLFEMWIFAFFVFSFLPKFLYKVRRIMLSWYKKSY